MSPARERRIPPVSTARRSALTPHQLRRAELRRRVEEIKAKRDARDVQLAEEARTADVGQPRYSIEELRHRLGLKD